MITDAKIYLYVIPSSSFIILAGIYYRDYIPRSMAVLCKWTSALPTSFLWALLGCIEARGCSTGEDNQASIE